MSIRDKISDLSLNLAQILFGGAILGLFIKDDTPISPTIYAILLGFILLVVLGLYINNKNK